MEPKRFHEELAVIERHARLGEGHSARLELMSKNSSFCLHLTNCRDEHRDQYHAEPCCHRTAPSVEAPHRAGKESAERAADEVRDHIDGVHTARGLGAKPHGGTLVAQLDALHAGVDDDDADDHARIGVLEDVHDDPRQHHERGSDAVDALHSVTRDVFTYVRGRKRSGHTTEGQHAYRIAVGKEGRLLHPECQTSPEAEHRTEGKGRTDGVEQGAWIASEQRREALHQRAESASVGRLHIGEDAQDDQRRKGHDDGRNQVHRTPSHQVTDVSADYPRRQDAYQQARQYDAHLALLLVRPRKERDEGDEHLRRDGAEAGDERRSQQQGGTVGHVDCQQGNDYGQEAGQDRLAAIVQVAQRDDEEQAECVTYLCEHWHQVDLEGRKPRVLADHIEQRLAVVDVCYRDACHHGQSHDERRG